MKLVILSENLQTAITMMANIDTSQQNSSVSFIVDKPTKTLTVISGQHPKLAFCNLKLDNQSTALQAVQFSIEGSFCKQLFNECLRDKDSLILDIEMESSSPKHLEVIRSFNRRTDKIDSIGVYRCRCEKIDNKHLAFQNESKSLPTQKLSKSTAEAIVYEATGHLPFQYIELNHNKECVRIQRNGEIEESKLPDHINLSCDIVLNSAATELLEQLCREPDIETIEIAQQGEDLTLKTNNQTVTCLLAGVEEFYDKVTSSHIAKKSIVLNWYNLKGLFNAWLANKCINKADDAIFYIDDTCFALFALNEPIEFGEIFPVKEISPSAADFDAHLFSFHPREVSKLKIHYMVDAIDTKLTIMAAENGEYSLAIYQSLKDKLATYSIPIQKAEYHMPTVQKLLKKMKNGKTTKLKEDQQDLFGYSIMND